MILQLVLAAICLIVLPCAEAATETMQNERAPDAAQDAAEDAAAIRAHIESIFQAFIDGDIEKIHATHSDDWRGLLEGTNTPIKGIDEYMRANGIEWPRPANAPKHTPYYPAGTRYRIRDYDTHFLRPDTAVVSFLGDFERTVGNQTVTLRRFRIMDVYAKRKGSWIQVASHTVIDPAWRQEQAEQPMAVTPEIRAHVLAARVAVWRAWFANDRAALNKLIPEEAIAINSGTDAWADRAAILADAKGFVESGGKLLSLEFPKTELQIYGNTIIVYTTYRFEIEVNGKRTTESGRATEIFVRRGNDLVNTGWHLDAGK